MAEDVSENAIESEEGFFSSFINEIVSSPLNMCMLAIVIYLLYKIMKASKESKIVLPIVPQTPKLKKQDITLEQLKKYDGSDEHGRLCIGVNGKVFDVTRGKKFYGPGGPYSAFAGHDATRCFATFSVDVKEEYDDISDLDSQQMESVREWEMQFNEKYDYVGRLLKPGDVPCDYTDDEEMKEKDATVKKTD